MRYSKEQELELLVARLQDIALREHIGGGLYPEYVVYLEEVEQAIDLVVRGEFDHKVTIDGVPVKAGIVVAALDLEKFAYARWKAAEN